MGGYLGLFLGESILGFYDMIKRGHKGVRKFFAI